MINNELKELPEKWYVKPNTLEEAKIVAEYFDKEKCGLVKKDNYYSSILLDVVARGLSNNNWGLSYHSAHTEISFEQFKKWVLKENIQPKFEAGKWYKSLNTHSTTYYVKNKVINRHLDSFEEYISNGKHYDSNVNLGKEGTYKYELLTDLTEIQELLPDNHPDKITNIIKSKKVEDLVYPDVIHLESQEQLDEILKYNKKLYKSFRKDEPDMLFGQLDSTTGCGKARTGFYNNRSYNIYKFSDIIFPETKKEPKEKSLVGRYLKALVDNPSAGHVKAGEYGFITKHDVEAQALEADFPNHRNYLCSKALQKDNTSYALMPEDFIPESNPETKKEPVVKLEIGNHYEIRDFKGNKEVVEIVNIHTDIQKMNNLFNSTWNLESNTCIYEHKHISGNILINSDTTKRFDYFSDDSSFAKSAKLIKTNGWLYSTLGVNGLLSNTAGSYSTALGHSADTATLSFSTDNECKIHVASSSVNSQYPLTPTINLEFQEPIIITNKKQKVKQLFII